MRDNTKWIMLVTAAAFVALMVFEWGMDLSGQSSAAMTGGELGEVNGNTITYQEYVPIYRNLYQQRQNQQDQPITPEQDRQIEDQAWNQLITDYLIQEELDERGIEVTAEEIRQAARHSPPPQIMQNEVFHTDGQFDPQKYQEYLASGPASDQMLLQLESYYRSAIPRNKLYRQVLSGLYVSDQELWRSWKEQSGTARIRYISVDPRQRVSDGDVSVSEEEIETYYRANQDEFHRAARADVRVVALDKTPTAADTAAARDRARAIRAEIVAGADFAEVAERESADPTSASRGGALGRIQRGQTVPAFEEAAWSVPIGTLSEPVLTQFGFHLIRVDERTDESASVEHILIPIERTSDSEMDMLARADSLEVLGETTTLDEAAETLGLRVRTGAIDEDEPFVPGIGTPIEGADWAFHQASAGEISPVFESGEAFYMLELVETTPERTLSVDEASDMIEARLIRQHKEEVARERAREWSDAIRGGRSMEQVAQANGLEVTETDAFTRTDFVPGIGTMNAVVGAAFGLQPGETSGVVQANGRLYIVQTIDRQTPDRAEWEQQKSQQRSQMMAMLQRRRIDQFLAGLREQADIVDNRDAVLRAGTSQQNQNQRGMPSQGLF